jgi:hypothetical protein
MSDRTYHATFHRKNPVFKRFDVSQADRVTSCDVEVHQTVCHRSLLTVFDEFDTFRMLTMNIVRRQSIIFFSKFVDIRLDYQ